MNQPKRWHESAPNPKIRELLRAGLTDAPDAQALPRTAAALGLGAAVTVVAGSAGASATGAALATGSGTTSALVVGKWLAIGFLTGGVASAGLAVSQTGFGLRSDEAPQVAASVPAPKRAAAQARVSTPATDVPRPELSGSLGKMEAPGAPSLASSMPRANPGRVAAPKANERRGALAAEIAWIDSARRALASGDVDRSLAELDAFERARTLGVLDREAGLLRIDALRKKGDVAGARAVAERYLAAFPGDAHAPRLREFLDSTERRP